MRIAYADPPYIGQIAASRHYLHDPYFDKPAEVDHAQLITQLETYEGWALSCSSNTLQQILTLCPSTIRIGAWVKKAPMLLKGRHPTYAWEPVVYKSAEKRSGDYVLYDWLCADPGVPRVGQKHITGRKPDAFCFWLFSLLCAEPGDEFIDMFPGSGAVGRAWEYWCRQRVLWPVG